MGWFIKGDVVVVPFPFTDLTGNKRRPALVIANPDDDDVILCQITSVARNDEYAVPNEMPDFDSGALPVKSFIRSSKMFTATQHLILYSAGRLKTETMRNVTATIVKILEK